MKEHDEGWTWFFLSILARWLLHVDGNRQWYVTAGPTAVLHRSGVRDRDKADSIMTPIENRTWYRRGQQGVSSAVLSIERHRRKRVERLR